MKQFKMTNSPGRKSVKMEVAIQIRWVVKCRLSGIIGGRVDPVDLILSGFEIGQRVKWAEVELS